MGLPRDSDRDPALPSELNAEPAAKIIEIAHAWRRAGYRMIPELLRPMQPAINHKRIRRL